MDSTLSLIGLALRAGKLAGGEEPRAPASRARDCRLRPLAADPGAPPPGHRPPPAPSPAPRGPPRPHSSAPPGRMPIRGVSPSPLPPPGSGDLRVHRVFPFSRRSRRVSFFRDRLPEGVS